jgi:hypothetical protein
MQLPMLLLLHKEVLRCSECVQHWILLHINGSADMTIQQWLGNVAERSYEGHTDSVRALCDVPGLGFVSQARDMTLRSWTMPGDCTAV